MIGKKGKDFITIPIPTIDIPHFRYGERSQGGVGQGEGEPGDPLSQGDGQPGSGKAGQGEGQHILEVDVSLEELADILGEELALPRIEPRGRDRIVTTRIKYTGVAPSGPESLRHFKRTYKQALRRQIASGSYNWRRPVIVPVGLNPLSSSAWSVSGVTSLVPTVGSGAVRIVGLALPTSTGSATQGLLTS